MYREIPFQIFLSLKKELLLKGQDIKINGMGWSMFPHLLPGSSIKIAPITEENQLIPGNIVVFKKGERWIAHRIIAIERHQLITKGDAVTFSDLPISLDQVIGKVIGARLGGFPWPFQLTSAISRLLFGRTDPPFNGKLVPFVIKLHYMQYQILPHSLRMFISKIRRSIFG